MRPKILFVFNLILLIAGIAAIFYTLTNGIPFQQMGWTEKPGTRGEIRASSIIFFSLILIARYCFPVLFSGLWLTRWTKELLKIPLWVMAALFFLIYAAVQISVGMASHLSLSTRGYDLGIFAQAVWTTLHGEFLYSSLKGGICLLGDHFSPILLAAVPFYALWPDPRVLILLQSVFLAACFFAIAYLVWKKTQDRFVLFVFLMLYFLDRPTRSALRSDFRPEALVQPFIYLAFIFLENSKRGLFLLSLAAALLGKENMPGISFILGLYALLFKRWPKTGIAIMTASLAIFYFETQWLVPFLNTAGGGYEYQTYYAGSGNAAGNLLQRFFSGDSMEYAAQMLGAFLMLPLLHPPTFLLALPVLGQNMLSSYEPMRSMNYHYAYGLTPFLYISSIYAWASLQNRFHWFFARRHEIAACLLCAGIIFSAPSDYHHFTERLKPRTPHGDWIRGELAPIPSEDAVITHNRFIAQIPNRKYIYPAAFPGAFDLIPAIPKDRKLHVILDQSFWEEEQAAAKVPMDFQTVLKRLSELGFKLVREKEGFYWFMVTPSQ